MPVSLSLYNFHESIIHISYLYDYKIIENLSEKFHDLSKILFWSVILFLIAKNDGFKIANYSKKRRSTHVRILNNFSKTNEV